jgi:hypothetical protein
MQVKDFVVPAILLAALSLSPLTRAQNSKVVVLVDGWDRPVPQPAKGQVPGPAPRHDLSGVWELPGVRGGPNPPSARVYPAKSADLPLTPEGQKALKANRPEEDNTQTEGGTVDDPVNSCDPPGFPRVELYDLIAMQMYQTPKELVVIYETSQAWRNIWTDGRELPKEVGDPRWYGYSVGKWADDTTLVVDTVGLNPKSWIDDLGRPHSDDLKVEETFHRVNHDSLELTVAITDPKMYTKPWIALNKSTFGLQPDWFDVREKICAPSDQAEYKQLENLTGVQH